MEEGSSEGKISFQQIKRELYLKEKKTSSNDLVYDSRSYTSQKYSAYC